MRTAVKHHDSNDGLTIGRAMDDSVGTVALGRLFGFVLGVNLLFRFIGSFEAVQSIGLAGLIPLVVVLYLFVRLFAIPRGIVAGQSIGMALRASSHRTFGRGWTVFGLILVVGLGAWLLAFVPHVGTLLTIASVAPVHAVAIAVLLQGR